MSLAKTYNPDVLSCLANLSNDEVFTPPALANQMLDLLPNELWSNPKAKFLDPFCKTGVFLREITRRLNQGLKDQIADDQDRVNHILTTQVYGIAITEMTALISRRSLYCSKLANGERSICTAFDNPQGNISYRRFRHRWVKGRCEQCGASEQVLNREEGLEAHAYALIHMDDDAINEGREMKFDVIVGNPPYQLSDAGESTSSSPIYQLFVQQAKKLSPRYLLMIIPSRWFAGGKGLDDFRNEMLTDQKISHLSDYPIAAEVFPGIKLIGGVCFFLRDSSYLGDCVVTSYMNHVSNTVRRDLNQYDTFVRFNQAISILEKVKSKNLPSLSELVSRQKPFGLRTFVRPTGSGTVTLYANKSIGKIPQTLLSQGFDLLKCWKVFISRVYGEGGESREYPRMIMGKPIIGGPMTACTETYLVIGNFKSQRDAVFLAGYLRTRFLRFLLGLRKNTQDITKDRFKFVPQVDLSRAWSDADLYDFFGLNQSEIEFIESMVRPMQPELEGEDEH
jgi:site-specific DNA-methyltransferase (adenine-specific)